MEKNEIISTIERVIRLEAEQKILAAEIERMKDDLKATMSELGVSKMEIGGHKVSNTTYTQRRFDSKAFKTDHEDMYNEYVKEVEAHRFTIS